MWIFSMASSLGGIWVGWVVDFYAAYVYPWSHVMLPVRWKQGKVRRWWLYDSVYNDGGFHDHDHTRLAGWLAEYFQKVVLIPRIV